MKTQEDVVMVEFTREEVLHLIAMLRVAGFREKRDITESLRNRRNSEMKIIGKVMKKLRKASQTA